MNKEQAFENYEEQLDMVVAGLDEVLTSTLGEEAEWTNHVGVISVPDELREFPRSLSMASLQSLWLLREECNSTLDWVQRHQEEGYKPEQVHTVLNLLREERRKMVQSQLIADADREFLVYCALSIGFITHGRAGELLGKDLLDVRDGLADWLKQQSDELQTKVDLIEELESESLKSPSTSELIETLEGMALQYLSHINDTMSHDFMSAGEQALEVLEKLGRVESEDDGVTYRWVKGHENYKEASQ